MWLTGKTECQKTWILDLNSFIILKWVTWPGFFFFFFGLVKLRNWAERSRVPSFKSFVKCKVLYKCELQLWFHAPWNIFYVQTTCHHCKVPYIALRSTQFHNIQPVFQGGLANSVFWPMTTTSFYASWYYFI